MAVECVKIEGVDEVLRKFDRISTRRDMGKDLKVIIRAVLKDARKDVSNAAKTALKGNDPRKAYLAVKYAVYRSVFGGNVSILSRRSRSNKGYQLPPNKRGRSGRTEQLEGYYGADRGFILRFMESGTGERNVKRFNDHSIKRTARPKGKRIYKHSAIGARGKINAMGWFDASSTSAIVKAANQLQGLVDEAVERLWNKD